MSEEQIVVAAATGGTDRIAVRWSPYWRTSDGCLQRGQGRDAPAHDAARARRPDLFIVSADSALDTLAGTKPSCTLP